MSAAPDLFFQTPLKTFRTHGVLLDADGSVSLLEEDGDHAPTLITLDDFNEIDSIIVYTREGVGSFLDLHTVAGGRLSAEPLTRVAPHLLRFNRNDAGVYLKHSGSVIAYLPRDCDDWRDPEGERLGGLLLARDRVLQLLLALPPRTLALGPRSRLSPLAI
jgi:hypothetical protein